MKVNMKRFAVAVAAALLEPVKNWHERAFVLHAVVNTKASGVTDADATPPVKTESFLAYGKLREFAGTVEAVSGDSIGSTYRMFRVHSSWRPSEIVLKCDAITTCAGDVGLCDTADNGGAAVNASFFASAQSLAAALVGTNVTHESGVYGVEAVEKRIWEALGLTTDPNKHYDVVVTLTAAAGSAGTISLLGRFVTD